MLKAYRANKYISKEFELYLYEIVGVEVENGEVEKGLWTMAFSKAKGESQLQKAIYIDLRVERIKEQSALVKSMMNEYEQLSYKNTPSIDIDESYNKKQKFDFTTKTSETKVILKRLFFYFVFIPVVFLLWVALQG